MKSHSLNVLLVEDDESAATLFRLVAERSGFNLRLQVAEDGEEAVAYLTGAGVYSDRSRYPLPDLVVLDLTLPGISGLEVLDWRLRTEKVRGMPVVVFTGSMREADRQQALAKGAAQFVTKPTDLSGLQSAIDEILGYARKQSPKDQRGQAPESDVEPPRGS